jgi:predicted ATPase
MYTTIATLKVLPLKQQSLLPTLHFLLSMPYKIALIGAHGTGKTALLGMVEGELRRRGINVASIKEMLREAHLIGMPINQQTTRGAQLWILHRQFAEEIALQEEVRGRKPVDVILCDRGPDNYCYLKHAVGEDAYALSLTLGHLKTFPYAQLYLLPIVEKTIADDRGMRALQPLFQKQMDTAVRVFLERQRIPYVELPLPHKRDNFRNVWVKIIVNQTLHDLGRSKDLFMENTRNF